ncbi:hypothetical protein C9374_008108 [Naegleria lovaniensis]|uniref:Uncharacterized protein n=1 Tax=Naegleria lovaniensis TaxID=51637 RepID=A0AA88GJ66_NAELO|nr:uncharacterized protein C9374_008108 [Naegleria lovaniensis]KAG2378469.1 hypothetical protein C9374_008108 [Naegleria lovaniensis]
MASSSLELVLLQHFDHRNQPSCPLSVVASFIPPSDWLQSLFLLSSKIYEPFKSNEGILEENYDNNRFAKEQLWLEQCQFSFPDVLWNYLSSSSITQRKEFKKLFIQQCHILKRYKDGLYHHACLEGHLASVNALCCTNLEKSLSITIPTLFSGDLKSSIAQWDLRSTLQMKSSDYHCNDEGKIIKILSYQYVQKKISPKQPPTF